MNPMKRTMRLYRLAVSSIGLALVACTSLTILSAHEPTMLERSTRVLNRDTAQMHVHSDNPGAFAWVSDHEVLTLVARSVRK